MKRIAYGYKRTQADFAHIEYDHIFFDTDKARPVLAETIRDYFYAGHGDVMLLVVGDDIPTRGPFLAALGAKGAKVEVHDAPDKRGRGRPRSFEPTPKQEAEARIIWETPYYRDYAAKLISELMGCEITRFALSRYFDEDNK